MDIQKLYNDFNIPYATAGRRNVSGGWIGVDCPFCAGAPDNHLGYNLDGQYYSCWRCGPHSTKETLIKLLNVNEKTALSLINKYGGSSGIVRIKRTVNTKPFSLPTGCGSLRRSHEQYLQSRNFDPKRLEHDWGLFGTGPISQLDGSDYRFRIIAPIRWDENIVSFQGRDITDKHKAKYKACPGNREKIPHKHVLYGNQERWCDTGVIVEGITDVWRLGPASCATFGIKFTPFQVRAIGTSFTRSFIIFDDEPQAQIQARKLKRELGRYYRDPDINIKLIKGDPGAMSQSEADYLMKQLIK